MSDNEELRRLSRESAQGEWTIDDEEGCIFSREGVIVDSVLRIADAQYIVAACNALPQLLDALAAAEQREAQLRSNIDVAIAEIIARVRESDSLDEIRRWLISELIPLTLIPALDTEKPNA